MIESFEYLKPYPQVDLLFLEAVPQNFPSFNTYKKEIERRKLIYKDSLKNPKKLEILFANNKDHFEAAKRTGAKSVLYEGELYNEQEFKYIEDFNIVVDNYLKKFNDWICVGLLNDGLAEFKGMRRKLYEGLTKRDGIISSRLPAYCKENKISSVYMRFGVEHRGLANSLPNAKSRLLEIFKSGDLRSGANSDDSLMRDYILDLCMNAYSNSKNYVEDLIDFSEFLQLFDYKTLGECFDELVDELRKKHLPLRKFEYFSDAIQKVLLNKLKEVDGELERLPAYYKIDVNKTIPKIWQKN